MIRPPLAREVLPSRLTGTLRTIQSRPEAAFFFAWAIRHRLAVAAILYAGSLFFTLPTAIFVGGHPFALVALLALPAGWALRTRPRLALAALVVGGVLLRLSVWGDWQADQVAVSQAAGNAAFLGYNPYGHGFGAAVPPGAPFPYGPLALVTGLGGQLVELAASIATMVLFIATGSWMLAGLYAADGFSVYSATQGVNDLLPGLLIAIGLLQLRRRPLLGGLILATAAAIKPYAFAWFPAAVGYAGVPALIGLAGASALYWSPLLEWGLDNFLKSVAMARAIHPLANALNIPELRILGVPLAIASLWARRWEVAVAGGAVVFIVVLFFDRWASAGYWLAIIPICGIVLEEVLVRDRIAIFRALRPPRLERLRGVRRMGEAQADT